ncbi:MAG: M12 family metallo-peptidase [Candidatus Kapaibacterium sp.]|nr:zinc-dependent metalloprotease [Bacteroidota bacterium]
MRKFIILILFQLFSYLAIAQNNNNAFSLFYSLSNYNPTTQEQEVYDSAITRIFISNPTIVGVQNPISIQDSTELYVSPLPNKSYLFQVDKIYNYSDSAFTWVGRVDTTAELVLSINNKHVNGYIISTTDTIEFYSLSDTIAIAYRILNQNIPEDSCNIEPTDTSNPSGIIKKINPISNKNRNSLQTSCPKDIKVLFLYTNSAYKVLGSGTNVFTMSETWIADMNETARNSTINQTDLFFDFARGGNYLAGYASSPIQEYDSPRLTLDALKSSNSVKSLRNETQADVVVLMCHVNDQTLLKWSDVAGYADDYNVSSENAVLLVQVTSSPSRYTSVHEISHLFGCRHDTLKDPTTSPYSYGHGYVRRTAFTTDPFKTVVSTYGTANRIKYWSTPLIAKNSIPIGSALYEDNRRVMMERAEAVANFRGDVVTSIDGPQLLLNGCTGTWTVQVCGTGSSNATYQWYFKHSRSSANWVSGGTGTSATKAWSIGLKGIVTAKCIITIGNTVFTKYFYTSYSPTVCSSRKHDDSENQEADSKSTAIGTELSSSNSEDLTIVQNPAQDKLLFKYNINQSTLITCYLHDSIGKLVYKSENLQINNSQQITSIDITKMNSGLYIFSIQVNGKTISKSIRIVK